MSSFARLAVAVTAAFALVSSSALAVIDVEGNNVTFAWTPSSGPVVYYSVYLDKNGEGFTNAVAAYVSEPRVTIPGQFGERIRICVIAWGWDGSSLFSSVPSLPSEEVRFVDPAQQRTRTRVPPPPNLLARRNGGDALRFQRRRAHRPPVAQQPDQRRSSCGS